MKDVERVFNSRNRSQLYYPTYITADLFYSLRCNRLINPMKLTPQRWFAVLISLGFAVVIQAADKPNVVFILVDDLGWTDLSSYGSDLYETPHVDRLAD